MLAVFLDKDGVIRPYSAEECFYECDERNRKLVSRLVREKGINYLQYDICNDVLPAYYDWSHQALARIKWILDETGAKIIVSSDDRSTRFPDRMHDLLAIHGLDEYWYADNIILPKGSLSYAEVRAREIEDSLNRYPIDNFVVIDDMRGLRNYFPDNIVITYDLITTKDAEEAVKILKRPGF